VAPAVLRDYTAPVTAFQLALTAARACDAESRAAQPVVPARLCCSRSGSAQPQGCGPNPRDYLACAFRAGRFARLRLIRTATNTPASGANQYA